ncbi:MAG: hypothetical protein VKN33_01515 [Candidatus Sericytochromatia bacterium]|nr:hypothetical protein [Candidatus Sericytochromatia bacterium]
MLKIQHPAAIVRDRQKQVTSWESVRYYRYANGVELQLLVGSLPHGELQSAISANRSLLIEKHEGEATIKFGETPLEMVDFMGGARFTAESDNTKVLDPCRFLPTTKANIRNSAETCALVPDGDRLVATFPDGTRVDVEPHGGHGHVSATRDGKRVKCFFHGPDNTLDILGSED